MDFATGVMQPPATCTYEPGVVDILLEEEGATNDAKASEATNGTDSDAALEAKVAKLRRWQEAVGWFVHPTTREPFGLAHMRVRPAERK